MMHLLRYRRLLRHMCQIRLLHRHHLMTRLTSAISTMIVYGKLCSSWWECKKTFDRLAVDLFYVCLGCMSVCCLIELDLGRSQLGTTIKTCNSTPLLRSGLESLTNLHSRCSELLFALATRFPHCFRFPVAALFHGQLA